MIKNRNDFLSTDSNGQCQGMNKIIVGILIDCEWIMNQR